MIFHRINNRIVNRVCVAGLRIINGSFNNELTTSYSGYKNMADKSQNNKIQRIRHSDNIGVQNQVAPSFKF